MALESFANSLPIPLWAFILIAIWELVWKGLALWKSARLYHPIWFVAMLVINTFGILPILYIFVFSEMLRSKEKNVKPRSSKVSKKKRR